MPFQFEEHLKFFKERVLLSVQTVLNCTSGLTSFVGLFVGIPRLLNTLLTGSNSEKSKCKLLPKGILSSIVNNETHNSYIQK